MENQKIVYSAKVLNNIKTGENTWDYLNVGVFENDKQIGEYIRKYSSFYGTFAPFMLNGKWYALYSSDYTCTRIMELPSCKDIGGEEGHSSGFCPIEFYIPRYNIHHIVNKELKLDEYCRHYENDINMTLSFSEDKKVFYENYAFVAGCIWGDDMSWKIRYADLSQADKGLLNMEEKFGYVEMPPGMKLKECALCDGKII